MKITGRQKLTIISLLIYWPILCLLSHIPIPKLVYQARVSDKAIHVLAYLILTFLLWFAVNPGSKVNWRKAIVWWILLAIAIYSAADEFTQSMVGRGSEFADFFANMTGVLLALIFSTLFVFWPAFLIVTGMSIFLVTNLAKANISELLPIGNLAFHLAGYALFTALSIRCINQYMPLKKGTMKWLLSAWSLPMALLLIVKVASVIIGKEFEKRDVIVSFAAITAVVVMNFLIALFQIRAGKLKN